MSGIRITPTAAKSTNRVPKVEKTITNNNVQFVIPISHDNGLIMSSYSDCANARYWNNLLATKGLMHVKHKLNEKLFNVPDCPPVVLAILAANLHKP